MKVDLYSDGSARGNGTGPGGYGTLLRYVDPKGETHEKQISAGYRLTTNNRMELMGVIAGLEALTRPCSVRICSDSSYVIRAFTDGWIDGWRKSGWKNSKKETVKNRDLWERLLAAMAPHTPEFVWVKGHAGHPENELCDRLATGAADGEDLLTDEVYEAETRE